MPHVCTLPLPATTRPSSTWTCFCGKRYRLQHNQQWVCFSEGNAVITKAAAALAELGSLLRPGTPYADLLPFPLPATGKAASVLDLRWPDTDAPLPDFICVDNHRFAKSTLYQGINWFALYLAGLARSGDRRSANWLIALNITIIDLDGRTFWPDEDGSGQNAAF